MFFDFPQNNDFQVSTVSQIFKNIYIHENKHFLGATQPKKTALNKQKNTHTHPSSCCVKKRSTFIQSFLGWLVPRSNPWGFETMGVAPWSCLVKQFRSPIDPPRPPGWRPQIFHLLAKGFEFLGNLL